jgi:F-box and WD-40 domain protein CDC4
MSGTEQCIAKSVVRRFRADYSECVYALQGHTSTIRCLRVLDRLPICVTGSRDGSLRVWDLQKGEQRHVMLGHTQSVRCLDIAGNLCVSGSYDGTARVSLRLGGSQDNSDGRAA